MSSHTFTIAHPDITEVHQDLGNIGKILYYIMGVWRVLSAHAYSVDFRSECVTEVARNASGDIVEKPHRIRPNKSVCYAPEPWAHIIMTAAWSLRSIASDAIINAASRVFMIPMRIEPDSGMPQVWGSLDTRYDVWSQKQHGDIELPNDPNADVCVCDVRYVYDYKKHQWYVYKTPEFSFTGGSRDIVKGQIESIEVAALREFHQEAFHSLHKTDFQPVRAFLTGTGQYKNSTADMIEKFCKTDARWIVFPMSPDFIHSHGNKPSDVAVLPDEVAITGVLTAAAAERLSRVAGPRLTKFLRIEDVMAYQKVNPAAIKLGQLSTVFHEDALGYVVDGKNRRVPVLAEQMHADWTNIQMIAELSVRNTSGHMFIQAPESQLRSRLLNFMRTVQYYCAKKWLK